MVVSTRIVLLIGLCLAACNGSNGGDDDQMPTPDANVPQGDCPGCAAPDECCEINGASFCLVTASDLSNCGGCGMACDLGRANKCVAADCKCGFGPECGDGFSCCGDGCKDTLTDEQNCGGCGPSFACGLGATCEGGVCSCGGMQCQAGEMCCDNVCTNTLTDANHCGGCSPANVCSGMTSSCNNGVCGCPGGGGACPAAGAGVVPTCCPGGCVDVCAAITDCGACGHACPAGDICFFGACFIAGEDPLDMCVAFP
jgi:hypothetical protein